jgi:hypothetical protein
MSAMHLLICCPPFCDCLLWSYWYGCRYNQGVGRLTMLLNAMAAHGTIYKEGDAFRYKSRTPTPERKPSPTASRR